MGELALEGSLGSFEVVVGNNSGRNITWRHKLPKAVNSELSCGPGIKNVWKGTNGKKDFLGEGMRLDE